MTYMPTRYSHASAGKANEPHAGEITALVQELKRRKLALETKNPVLAERLVAIAGGLKQLIGGAQAIRGDLMPFTLFPGEEKEVSLGLSNWLAPEMQVRIRTQTDRTCKYSCVLYYFHWHKDNGFVRTSATFASNGRADTSFTVGLGGRTVAEAWLKSKYDQLNSRNALEEFEGVVAATVEAYGERFQPRLKFKYENVELPPPSMVRIRPANQGVPVTADKFWVTTTTR